MLKVGLTGGVGCGKSTVSELFGAKSVPVFDADRVARELVEPGQPALAAIVAKFGSAILADGRLNRQALRDRVYSDPGSRRELEAILHPLVYQSLREKSEHISAPYGIFCIPLLVESGRQGFVHRILVVDCTQEQQYQRVRRRDGLDDRVIGRILEAQASREDKLAAADDVIENDGDMGALQEQVDRLHQVYLRLAPDYP